MKSEGKDRPLISIVVPVYNVKQYIDRCVESIVKQSYKNIEILLVDDGSNDGSSGICDTWSLRDLRIKVIHVKNGGLSNARNIGIELSVGEYICFVDSDDYIESNMIEKLYESSYCTQAEMTICNFVYEYENNEIKNAPSLEGYQINEKGIFSGEEFLQLMLHGKYVFGIVAWNKLYKRCVWDSIRYPIGKIHEDEYVFHEIISICNKISCIPDIGYHYYQRKGSITSECHDCKFMIEALLDRCLFFMNKGEKRMTILSEPHLLYQIKQIGKRDRKEAKPLMKEYMRFLWKIYLRKWIPARLFIKRLVRISIVWGGL